MIDSIASSIAPATAPRPQTTGTGSAEALRLSAEEQQVVAEMAARDREVRLHENAHVAAGGPYAGSASYEYDIGPDRRRYAVSGEVPIDVSPVSGDPEATVAKMRIVESAALAPPEPSPTDRAIAALARARKLQAEAEMAANRSASPLSVRL